MKGAEIASQPGLPRTAVEGALKWGKASGIGAVIDDGLAGADQNALGGAGVGAIGRLLKGFGGKTKPVASPIRAGMSTKDKEQYSHDHAKSLVRVFAGMYR